MHDKISYNQMGHKNVKFEQKLSLSGTEPNWLNILSFFKNWRQKRNEGMPSCLAAAQFRKHVWHSFGIPQRKESFN